MEAPAGIVQTYEVAPVDPLVQYCSIPFAQGTADPVIVAGVEGAPVTTSVRAGPAPHELVAETDNVQLVKFAGQSTDTALKLVGPTSVPHVVDQL